MADSLSEIVKRLAPGGVFVTGHPGYMEDPVVWVREKRPFIEAKTGGLVPFELYPVQEAALRKFAAGGTYFVEKGRQQGFTTGLLAAGAAHQLLYSQIVRGRPFHFHVFADSGEKSLDLLRKVKTSLSTAELSSDEKQRLRGHDPRAKITEITYWTDAAQNYVRSHTTTEQSVRGYDGNSFLLEEFAFTPDAERIWQSVYPMVADVENPTAWVVSTPHQGGSFHETLCDEAAKWGGTYWPVDWRGNPTRDEAWKAREIARLGETLFGVEHELLRMGAGSRFFHVEVLAEHASRVSWYGREVQRGHRYVKGADLSERGDDKTVLTVVDVTTRPAQVVYVEEHGKLDATQRKRVIEAFAQRWEGPLFVDGTKDPSFVETLQVSQKQPIRFRGGQDETRSSDGRWLNIPRDNMLSALRTLLETGRLVVHKDHFAKLWEALETSVYQQTRKDGNLEGSAKAKRRGKWPDHLDSLMLAALYMRKGLMTTEGAGASGRSVLTIPSSPQLQELRNRRW